MPPTILGANGRPLTATRPAGTGFEFGGWITQSLTDRWTDATEDGIHGFLKSFEQLYRSQPVLSSVVDKLSRRVATLPFAAFQLDGLTREPVDSSDSLATLLRRPWPRASTVDLIHHIEQSMLVHGNAILAKVRTDGDRDAAPDMLWPLDWSKISAYGQEGGLIEWWSTTQFGGLERFVRAEDVLHFSWSSPGASQIGVSPIEKLGVTLRLDDATVRHQTAQYRNGSRPSLAVGIEHPNPTRDMLLQAKAIIEEAHKGMDQSGGTLFTGANATVKPLSLTPAETELIEQRRLSREEVGMVYDLAGPLMNDLTHGTYSNVTELQKGLYRDVIPPWTELIVQTFQAQLLDQQPEWLDRVVRFDFTDKLKGEPRELAETLKIEVEAGLRTRNEARGILGLPPDGDPDDPDNPANQLTANVNNQAPVNTMGTESPVASPASQE